MPNHRMFSFRIANSAKFLQMPEGAQNLYFHAVVRADDDGVVEIYPIIQLLGAAPDNLKILLAKGFLAPLNEDQVVVIIDWLEHNTIRADRKINSIYIDELKKRYPMIRLIEPKPRGDVGDNSRRLGSGQSTVSVSKGKLSQGNTNNASGFDNFWEAYPRKTGKKKAEQSWNRINPKPALTDLIMQAMEKHKGSEQWSKDGGIFIPYPATWLNQERWNDEVIKALPAKKKPYFHGMPIIEIFGKKYCLKNGEKLEFAGKESEIEYK